MCRCKREHRDRYLQVPPRVGSQMGEEKEEQREFYTDVHRNRHERAKPIHALNPTFAKSATERKGPLQKTKTPESETSADRARNSWDIWMDSPRKSRPELPSSSATCHSRIMARKRSEQPHVEGGADTLQTHPSPWPKS